MIDDYRGVIRPIRAGGPFRIAGLPRLFVVRARVARDSVDLYLGGVNFCFAVCVNQRHGLAAVRLRGEQPTGLGEGGGVTKRF